MIKFRPNAITTACSPKYAADKINAAADKNPAITLFIDISLNFSNPAKIPFCMPFIAEKNKI